MTGDRKNNILKISKRIAHEEGLSSLTIRRVAKEGNIAVGSVYNIFNSKDDLILSIMEDYWEGAMEDLMKADYADSDYFIDNLSKLYGKFKDISRSFHIDWMRDLVGFQMKNPKVTAISNKYKDMLRDEITKLLMKDSSLEVKFDHEFKREDLSEFIFENIMILLGEGKEDLGFLKILLEKLLY